MENNDQSYCAFEYVGCGTPDPRNGLVQIEEFYAITDECYNSAGNIVVNNPGCDGIGLDGRFADSFEDLTALKRVIFFNPQDSDEGANRLSGSLPLNLPKLTNLEIFDVSRNLLEGTLPEDIGNLTRLVQLGISQNRISTNDRQSPGFSGTIPRSIQFLQGLTALDLSVNSFTGEIPPEIGNLTNLVTVALQGNELSGELPDEIQYLTQARVFTISQNKLEGPLERELENGEMFCPVCFMVSLVTFEANPSQGFEGGGSSNRNRFTGSIPTQINQLTNLVTLALNDNAFTGCIPDNLSDLVNLRVLALQNNQLGTNETDQPCSLDVIGDMTRLQQISLRNNRFNNAVIPASWGNLGDVTRFYIDHMGLTGDIPEGLAGVIAKARVSGDCCVQFDRVPVNSSPDCFAQQLLNFPAVATETCQIQQGTGQPIVDVVIVDDGQVPYPSNAFTSLPSFLCDTRMVLVDGQGNLVLDDDGNAILTLDEEVGVVVGCDGAGGLITTERLGIYPFPEPQDYIPISDDCETPSGYEPYQAVPDGPNESLVFDVEKGISKCKVDRTVANWCVNSDITLPRSSPYSATDAQSGGVIGGQLSCRNFN